MNTDDTSGLGAVGTFLKKVGLTLAAIAFIAGLFAVAGDGEVSTASADIYVMGSGKPPSKQEKFVDTLVDYGLSEPRTYDWNGNAVFFSQGETRKSPEEVQYDLQDAFVRNGVNKYFHPRPVDPGSAQTSEEVEAEMHAGEDYLTGGLVPLKTTRDHIVMNGVQSSGKERNLTELLKKMAWSKAHAGRYLEPEQMMANFRYVEAYRKPGQKRTTITAAFSEEALDLNRFKPSAANYTPNADQEIPPCVGCKRITRFAGTGAESDKRTILFESPNEPKDELQFYRAALQDRGWKPDPSLESVWRLGRDFGPDSLRREGVRYGSFSRNGRFATMLTYVDPKNSKTYVYFTVSD